MLHLEIEGKGNKKGFYKNTSSKRKSRENMGPLLNVAEDLMTENMEEAEALRTFFASVSTGMTDLWVPETSGKDWRKDILPSVEKDQGRAHLNKLNKLVQMGEKYP